MHLAADQVYIDSVVIINVAHGDDMMDRKTRQSSSIYFHHKRLNDKINRQFSPALRIF